MAVSYTQRSLAYLRKLGYLTAVVEKWNPHVRVKQDLFGFGDLLATGNGSTILVQSSDTGHHKDRLEKILSRDLRPNVMGWLRGCSTNRIIVLTFAKRGKRGQRKVWTPKVTEIKRLKNTLYPFLIQLE